MAERYKNSKNVLGYMHKGEYVVFIKSSDCIWLQGNFNGKLKASQARHIAKKLNHFADDIDKG